MQHLTSPYQFIIVPMLVLVLVIMGVYSFTQPVHAAEDCTTTAVQECAPLVGAADGLYQGCIQVQKEECAERLSQADAAVAQDTGQLIPQCALTTGSCTICDIFTFFGKISDLILSFISSIVILMVVIGGVFWITSAGNAERVDRGKQIILGAFIGGVFVFTGFVIINLTMLILLGGSNGQYEIVAPFASKTPWNEFCENPATISSGVLTGPDLSATCNTTNLGAVCGTVESGIGVSESTSITCPLGAECRCVSAYDIQSVGTSFLPGTSVEIPDITYKDSVAFFCAPSSATFCAGKPEGEYCYRPGSDYIGLCKDDECTYNYLETTQLSVCGPNDDGRSCQACSTPGACYCKEGACTSKCEERVRERTGAVGQCVSSVEECETPGGTVYHAPTFSCGTGTGPSLGGGVCCGFLQ